MSFVHLHLHSEYSLLDGAIRIKDLPKLVKSMGMNSCAITDHGSMYGIIDFYNACKKEGVKPILGCEVYVAPRSRNDKEVSYDKDPNHLILLAKDNIGFKNLIKLVSIGFTEGFYYRPRIDKEVLKEHSQGIIALSACLAGEIPRLLMKKETQKAKEVALEMEEIFGKGNYYLEIQHNNIPEQNLVNAGLINISNITDIPLVATNDCHYLRKQDAKAHEILLCMQTGKKMSDPDRMRMMSDEFFVKSPEEMQKNFEKIPQAIKNTQEIADKCDVSLDFNTIHLPEFIIPDEYGSHDEYLKKLSYEGLEKKLNDIEKKDLKNYEKRLEHELSVISKMGFTDYFLIVWDFIDFAAKENIIVGPGRGSGAGSLVAYSLGITNINPIKYDLLFERFLNQERVSMPDFDIDFCYERRQEVIDYVTNKYGKDRVAQVITFGTLAARACVKDVARALDVPYAKSDLLAKMIPQTLGVTLKKALETSPELKSEYENNPQAKEVIDTAILFEGMPRHSSTHAAGVIISGKPLTDIAPLSKNDESIVVQYSKENIELVGLLKFDFLGLRTLTVMQETARMVKENYGVEIDFDKLIMDDENVYKMISDGNTAGVFQLESPGMTSFMKDLNPENLEDVIAGISLFRPGPMEQIPKYVESKHDKSKISYTHPLLEPILNVTYGCIVYQEQVMRIVRDLAGFSMAQSDIVRRAMSKKKPKELAKYKSLFIDGGDDGKGNIIDGAIKRGVKKEIAEQIFEEVMAFAGYAFNKSHAAAYAVIGYYTGWLKYYYPTEFMAAMLNSFMGNLDQAARYINACKKMGIEVLSPDINYSQAKFVTEDKKIRFALSAVKNVGNNAILNLIKERNENGIFTSFASFLERMCEYDVNKKMIESLIKSSAFDSLKIKRSNLMQQYEPLLNRYNQIRKSKMDGQMTLFDFGDKEEIKAADDMEFSDLDEFIKSDLLSMEKEVLGLYISGHPLDEYMDLIAGRTNCDSSSFANETETQDKGAIREQRVCDGQRVVMAGLCLQRKNKTTRRNDLMSFLTIEDLNGQFECIVFSKILGQFNNILNEGNVLMIRGRVSAREDESPSLIAEYFALIEKDDYDLKNFPKVYNEKRDYNNFFCEKNVIQNDNINRSIQSNEKKSNFEKSLTIYIGDENQINLDRACALFEYFQGEMPVKILNKVSNKIIDLPKDYSISFDDETLKVLITTFGKDNIRLN